MSFFHTIWGLLGSFLCIEYWGPQITFFAYYMGPLRSVSSNAIWGPLSDQFHCLLYGALPLRSVSLHAVGGPPQILVFSRNIWGPPEINFSAYYMGPPQVSFFAYYMGPLGLRSVSVHTFWGPPLRSVFSLTIWGPLRSVSRHTIWGPLSSVSSPTIWGSPEISFFAYYMRAPLRSVSSLTIWGPH